MRPLTFAEGVEMRRAWHLARLSAEAERRAADVKPGSKTADVAMVARAHQRRRKRGPLALGALGLKHAPIQGARNVTH